MDDLRWILLLVGAIAVVAIYFSSRFDGEDWARERKQSRTGHTTHTVKKEPGMGVIEPEPIAEKPDVIKANPVSPMISHDKEVTMEPTIKADPEIPLAHVFTIEDEITEIDIPIDLAVAEAEIDIADIELNEEQEAMPAGIEPLVLSVSVFADEEASFGGPEIKEALEAEGLQHGEMHIFHFHDPDKQDVSANDDAVFSVASVLEPGFFDLEKLNEMKTPGLMLFCQLPGPLASKDALEMMLDKGQGLAVRLHGHMCDDKRNRFTAQAKNHYLDRISAFNRKRVLARKKTPTD